jgi:predicted small integral membrane protein
LTIRISKLLLVAGIALFYVLVVFNNVTDFGSNWLFVQHVLSMDTTFPGNHGMWRALPQTGLELTFYLSIIGWETITTALLVWAVVRMVRALRGGAAEFAQAKTTAVLALTTSLLMWLIAFLAVGGEWFLMWQSKMWNGQEEAFRMFTVIGIVLLYLVQPEDKVLD